MALLESSSSAILRLFRKALSNGAGRIGVRIGIVLVLIAPFCRAPSLAIANDEQEHAVKAAFIYNFTKFVDWPPNAFEKPDSAIVIGIVGRDPFGQTIDRAIQGKNVGGHNLVLKRLAWDQDLKGCHILFVGASEKGRFGQLPGLIKNAPVLTVGEAPDFARKFGIVNFTMEEGNVKFEINAEAAKRAHLAVSSKLLSLAKIVTEGR